MAMRLPSNIAKRAISSCFFSSPQCHQLALLAPLLRSPLSTRAQPQKELPFIAHYLISSFGFSPDRALKYSALRNLAPIKSSARPETVVKFLSDTGLSDTQIKAVVSFCPHLLSYNVENTLKPKVLELIDAGCSGELLVQLIRNNPSALCLKDALSRFIFWRDFVGKDDLALSKIIQKNSLLIIHDIDKKITPKINLLKEFGLSNPDVVSLVQCGNRCMNQNPESFRQILELIEELGIVRGSRVFLSALKSLGGISKNTIKRKVMFFKDTYGWSQEDMCSAFRKFPSMLAYSEDKVKSKMDFLIRKAGFEPRSVSSCPVLIGLSLERVFIPRYTVLRALQDKGHKLCSFSTAFKMTERRFHDRYVVPFEKLVPGLGQAYVSAFGLKELV
jgi:mTERF domain-containing protein, mitochondrial